MLKKPPALIKTTPNQSIQEYGYKHHCFLEISKKAFEQNIAQYRTIIGPAKKLALVIKSNAYGHGIKEIASLAQKTDMIDWLCVSSLAEAHAVRSWGITKNILTLYLLDQDIETAIALNISMMADKTETLDQLESAGRSVNCQAKVHLKIDTGMHRFGFSVNDIPALIDKIKTYRFVAIEGIYTHFADADGSDHLYTEKQQSLFRHVITLFHQASIYPPFIHSANSAATSSFSHENSTFFRVGAGAYGLWPSPATKERTLHQHPYFSLTQIMSWKTYVYDIKKIPAGEYVGYGKSYRTEKETILALLPIGYYDGYHRRLSNNGLVKIGSFYAPVVGRIAMNTTWVDITEVPAVIKGDIVTLTDNDPHIGATTIAERIGSFNPREVTVRIHPAIARIFR